MAIDRLIYRRPAHHRWLNSIIFFALGLPIAAALAGLFGGRDVDTTTSGTGATLAVSGPSIIRNGEYSEMTISMTAHRPLANAVLEIDAGYWREMTINTMIPSPEKEELRAGVLRFEFGPVAAGESAGVKIDAQVNPHRFGPSQGTFVLRDGEQELARLNRSLRVIP